MKNHGKQIRYTLLPIFLVMALLAAALPSCDREGKTEESLSQLQALFSVPYDNMTLIVYTAAEVTLESRYELSRENDGVRVDYTVQTLAAFEEVDGVLVIPEDTVRTVEGSALIQGLTVKPQSGEACPHDLIGMGFPAYTVSEATARVTRFENGKFTLTVTNPDAFFGMPTGLSGEVILSGSFTEGQLTAMNLTATTAAGACSVRFSFS